METTKKTARIVGALFIAAMLTSMVGDALIRSIVDTPGYLAHLHSQKSQLMSGILLQATCAIAVVYIALRLLPILKRHSQAIAYGYLGFRVIESAIIFFSAVSILSLLAVSREFVDAGAPDVSPFYAIGALCVAGHYWAFQMVITICGIAVSCFIMCCTGPI